MRKHARDSSREMRNWQAENGPMSLNPGRAGRRGGPTNISQFG